MIGLSTRRNCLPAPLGAFNKHGAQTTHFIRVREPLCRNPSDMEPTQEMIDRVVEDRLDDIKRDPAGHLREMGIDLKDYVDKDALIKYVIQQDGYGLMSGYDGDVDEVRIGSELYYVIREN